MTLLLWMNVRRRFRDCLCLSFSFFPFEFFWPFFFKKKPTSVDSNIRVPWRDLIFFCPSVWRVRQNNTWTRGLVKHTRRLLPVGYLRGFSSCSVWWEEWSGWAWILKRGLTRFMINALYTLYYKPATSSCNGKYYSYREIYFGFDLLFCSHFNVFFFVFIISSCGLDQGCRTVYYGINKGMSPCSVFMWWFKET